jgi:WD40 repeat protein
MRDESPPWPSLMTADEALALLDTLLQEQSLRDIQEQVFRHSWEGHTYPDMAERIGYDTGYIRDIGSELWRQLTQILGESVTKNNLQAVLRRQLNREPRLIDHQASPVPSRAVPSVTETVHFDRDLYWGEQIDVSSFRGRATELQQLESWLGDHTERDCLLSHCRLISIVGMGGMGKTTLAAKLAHKLANNSELASSIPSFDRIIWQSLRHAPPLDRVLFHLIAILSHQQQIEPADTLDAQISQLMEYLRTSRCLIVFDNFESILAHQPSTNAGSNSTAGNYREGYAGYSEILRRIGTEHHTSCLLLTSREKPSTLIPLEGEHTAVCTMDLRGLSAVEVQAIVTANGCHTTAPSDWDYLQHYYSGNPLAIKIAATTIRDLFDGNITAFLEQGVILCDGIDTLLNQQFDRLSQMEKQVLYWLAIGREAVSISQLLADFIPSGFRSEVLGALQLLDRQSLIEKSAGCFTLQPVVMEYVTAVFIDRVCTEIIDLNLVIFHSHALVQADTKDYVRESQVRMVLDPLIEQLLGKLRSKPEIKHQLDRLLVKLQSEFSSTSSYAGGNLINLLCQLQIDLNGYDFSNLCIRQAYLLGTNLQNTNFANTNLARSVFTEAFSSIHAVAFSPDGCCLASGHFNGDILLWDAHTHQLQAILKDHTNWVQAVTFSPNLPILASGSFDGTVKLWDLVSGVCLKTFTNHTQGVYSVAFSPDGQILASGSDDCTIKFWDVHSGECLVSWHYEDGIKPHDVKCIAFSPDGQTLASSGSESTIQLWQIRNSKKSSYWQTLVGHQGWVCFIAFSPDGKSLASGSDDTTIKFWDIHTGQCLRTFEGHSNELRSIAFSRDGRMLISSSKDRTIRLWDVQTGQCVQTLVGHENWIWAMAFEPIHQIIASGGEDRTIRLWSLETGQCLKVLQGYTNTLYSIALVPPLDSTESIKSIDPNIDPNLAHRPVLLASGYFDQIVRLWNIQSAEYSSFRGHTDAIRAVAVSPDGQLLAGGGGSTDPKIKLWSIRDSKCQRNLAGHTSEIWSVAFSSDGQILASGSTDHTIRLWNIQTGECIQILTEHRHWVTSVAFSCQPDILASAGFDRVIKFWNVQTGACIRTWQGEQLAICSIAFSPGGDLLASGSIDRTIGLWDVASGERFQILLGHTHFVWSVAFSPDGMLLASGSFDRTVRLWDRYTGECLKVLQGHESGVFSVVFIPQYGINSVGVNQDCHQLLASSSADGTIRLWDVTTGKCTNILRSPRPYEGMNIGGAQGLTDAQRENLIALGAILSGA